MIKKIHNKISTDKNLKELLSGSAITFVFKISGMVLSYLLIYLISKELGAEGVGFYQIMLQTLTILGVIFGLGMNISILRYVGQFNNVNEKPKIKLIYRYLITILGPVTILASIILYFSSDWITETLNKKAEYAQGLKIIAISLPFFTINQVSVEFIRGLKKLKISEFLRSVTRPLIIGMGFLIVKSSPTKIDLIYYLLISLVINSLISRFVIWREMKEIPRMAFTFTKVELFRTSAPMILSSISSYTFGFVPIFFLDYFNSQSEVGMYSIAHYLSTLSSLILIILNTILAPKIAELYWSDKASLQKLLTQSSIIGIIVSTIFSFALIAFGHFTLGLFGEEFTSSYYVLVILVIAQWINTWAGSVGLVLNMTGNQKSQSIISVATFALLLVIYPLLIINFGKEGAALGTLIGMAIINLSSLFIAYKKTKLIVAFIPFKLLG